MALTFTPKAVDHGLDTSVSPAWQMVPVGGSRVITVSGVGSLKPRVYDSAKLRVAQTKVGANHQLTLTGIAEGRTWVEWVSSADVSGPSSNGFMLEVSVKKEKKIKTAFFYVDDGKKQKTKRAPGSIDTLIRDANKLLTAQANVTLVKKSAAALKVTENLGMVVRFSSHLPGVSAKQHEWDNLMAYRDAAADFNVFFVKEYEQDNSPFADNTDAGTISSDKMCVFEDKVYCADHEVLAHETLHFLGVSGHSASNSHLMAATACGRTIPKAHANQANNSGT